MPSAHFEFIGDISNVTTHAAGVELRAGVPRVRVRAVRRGVFEVRLAPEGESFEKPFSYAVKPEYLDAPLPETETVTNADTVQIQCGTYRAVIQRRPLRIRFEDDAGRTFAADDFGMAWSGSRVHVWKEKGRDEEFYGLGEKADTLGRHGNGYTNWNTDHPYYQGGDDPLYKTIPFYIGLPRVDDDERRAYGIFLDNSFRSHFDFDARACGHVSFGADGGELRYYVFMGPHPTDVLRRYTEMTGRLPLPPKWALGYHQSRWSYYPDSTVLTIARQFRERDIPLDVLHLDIDYMDEFRVFTWNRERFPEPERLVRRLREQGIKTALIIDPGIKIDDDYHASREGREADAFVTYPDGKPYVGPVWPGNCHFPDFTDPAARRWFGQYIEDLIDEGIAGFWTDMNEPSVSGGETFPAIAQHDLDGHGGNHLEAHNVYGLLMARSVFEAVRRHTPEQRPFILTRAAFAGIQRYAAAWTGDNVSKWSHLRLATPMLLSLGLSGVPFVGSDVGGFDGAPTPELYARWIQFGALSPFFRTHSSEDTPMQDPWAYGPRVEKIARRFIRLRYRLLPLLYTLFDEHRRTGLPIMRPLLLHHPHDDDARNRSRTFLMGEQLLAAPVMREGARSRTVYLPDHDATWFDFWSSDRYHGRQEVLVDAPLDQMPLFAKSGSVLPLAPAMSYVDEEPIREMELRVFPGNGTSTLYEDDGETTAYTNDAFRRTQFTVQTKESRLTLRRSHEGAYRSSIRGFLVRIDDVPRPQKIVCDDAPLDCRAVSGENDAHAEAAEYHASKRRLYIPVPSSFSRLSIAFDGSV